MKITKSKLKQIIKEELQQAIEENVLEELATIPVGGGKARDCNQLIQADGWKWGTHSAPHGTDPGRHLTNTENERLKEKFKKDNPDCARHTSFDELWDGAFEKAHSAGVTAYSGQ